MAIELGEREIVVRRRVPVRTRLEWLMRERDMTQADVARAAEAGEDEVSRWISGARRIPRNRVDAVCLALGTHPGFILEWTDDPRIPRGWENPLSSSSAERNGCSTYPDPDMLFSYFEEAV